MEPNGDTEPRRASRLKLKQGPRSKKLQCIKVPLVLQTSQSTDWQANQWLPRSVEPKYGEALVSSFGPVLTGSECVGEMVVPDSPDEARASPRMLSSASFTSRSAKIWPDKKRSRRPCKVPLTPVPSTPFEEMVVPDSPDQALASPRMPTAAPVTSGKVPEIIPVSQEDASQRPCKVRRTCVRKVHEESYDDVREADRGRDFPTLSAVPSGKPNSNAVADSHDLPKNCAFDQPAQVCFVKDHQGVDLTTGVATFPPRKRHSAGDKPLPVSADCTLTLTGVLPGASVHKKSEPVLYVPDTEDQTLVTQLTTASGINVEPVTAPTKQGAVDIIGGGFGAGSQGNSLRNVEALIPSGKVTEAARTSLPSAGGNSDSVPIRPSTEAWAIPVCELEKCVELVDISAARPPLSVSGGGEPLSFTSAVGGRTASAVAKATNFSEGNASFEAGRGQQVVEASVGFRMAGELRGGEIHKTNTELQFSVPRQLRSHAQTSNTRNTDDVPPKAVVDTSSASVHLMPTTTEGKIPVSSFVTGGGKSLLVSSVMLTKARKVVDRLNRCGKCEQLSEDCQCNGDGDGPISQPSNSTRSAAPTTSCSGVVKTVSSMEVQADTSTALDVVPIMSFTTGRGNPVSVSSEALKKASALLGAFESHDAYSCDDAGGDEVKNSGSNPGGSFSSHPAATCSRLTTCPESTPTVSGGAIEVDTTPFANGTTVCHSASPASENMPSPSPSFRGLSGRMIVISKHAMARAKDFVTPKQNPLHRVTAVESSSAGGGNYPRRSVRAFKPPRMREQPVDVVNADVASVVGPSASGTSAGSCTSQPYSVNACSTPSGTQPLQPPKILNHQAREGSGKDGQTTLRDCHEEPAAHVPEGLPPAKLRSMTADAADHYRIQHVTDAGRQEDVGSMEIWQKLLDLGPVAKCASKEWVANHYRWIIWKLLSSERNHPRQTRRQHATLDTVLSLLKLRYDQELSGRRPALRRITEGDSSASRVMVLCISAIRQNGDLPSIEVTDGWYRLNATLDAPLTDLLRRGKLEVGRKIQVCGAILCSCSDPKPPLEAFENAFLALHMNGTRRAHWSMRLGFCGKPFTPLAFHCIKPGGGVVAKTFVGVTRVYRILFREICDGGTVIRSARAEQLASDQFEQRRAKVAQDTILKIEASGGPAMSQEEKEEGYELFEAVEKASDPDIMLADMTSAQLRAFAAYQSKREASRRAYTEDAVKEALKHAGLESRNVKRMLKVRVTGLLYSRGDGNRHLRQEIKEGSVSIWDVSDEQLTSVVEGSVHCVSGLRPGTWTASGHDQLLHLQSYRSSRWRALPPAEYEKDYLFPYTPRAPMQLSNMDDMCLSREFDFAGTVVHVGVPFSSGSRTTQWVFVTDGSSGKNRPGDSWEELQLLAVRVNLPTSTFFPLEASLFGSVVGFCSLTQQQKDNQGHFWVAEASELSVVSLDFDSRPMRHLQAAAKSVLQWSKSCPWAAGSLRILVQSLTFEDTHGTC